MGNRKNIFKRLRDRLLCRKRDKADKSEPELEDSTFEKDGRWSEIPMGSRGESVVDKNGNCITPREDDVVNIDHKYTRRYVSLRAEVSDIRKGAQTLDSRSTTPQGSPREFHLPKPNFKPVYDETPVATRPNSPQESPEFHLPKPNFKPVYDESPVASRPCSPQDSPRDIHIPKPNFRPVYDESPVVSRAPTPQDSPREFHLPKPNFRPVYDESPIASRQASPVSAKDYDGTIDDQEAATFDCDESHRPVPRMNIRPLTPGSDESSSTVVAFQQVSKTKYGGLDHMRQIRRENAIRQKRMKEINTRKNGQPATVSKVADSGVNHQRKELVQYSPSQEFDVEQDDVTLDVHSQDDTPVVPVGNDDNESDYQESARPSDRPASKVFVFRPVAAKKYGGLGHMRQIQRENALRKERMKNIGKKVDDVKETPASQGNSARYSHREDYPIGPGDYGSVSHNKMVKAENMARQKRLKGIKSSLPCWQTPVKDYSYSASGCAEYGSVQHHHMAKSVNASLQKKVGAVKSKVVSCWQKPSQPKRVEQEAEYGSVGFFKKATQNGGGSSNQLKNVQSKIKTWSNAMTTAERPQWSQRDETAYHHKVGRDQMHEQMPPDNLKNVKSKINTWNQPTRPVQHSQWNQPDETEFQHEMGRDQMHQPLPPDLKNVKSKISTWNQPTRPVQHSQWNQPDETAFQHEVGRDQMHQPMPLDKLKNVKSKLNTWNQPTRPVQHSQWNQPGETDFQQEIGRDQMYQPLPPDLKNVKSKINTWNQPTRPVQNAQRNHPNDAAYHHNVGRDELAQHMPPDMAKPNGGAGSYQLKNVKSKINTWNKPKTTVQHPQWNQPDEPTFHQSRLHPIGRYDMHQQMPPVDRPDMYAEPYLSPRRMMHLDDMNHQRGRMVYVDTGGRIAKDPQQDDRRLKEYYTLPTMHGHGFSPGMPANIPDGISAPVPASSRQEHFPTAVMAQRSGMPANISDHSCVPLPPIMNQKQYNSTSKIPIYRSADNAAASMTSQDHFPTMEMMQRYQPGMPASIAERNGVPLPPIMSQKQHSSNSKIPIYSRYGHEPAQNIATQELSHYMPGHGSTMRMPGYEPSHMAATMCAGNTMRPPVNSSWNGVSTPMPPRQEHFPTVDHERMGSGVGRDQRSREVDRGIGVCHDTEVTPVNTPPVESSEDALEYKKRILGYLTSYKKWKSNQDATGRRPDHYTTYLSAIQDVNIRDELRAHMLKQTRHEYTLSDGAAKKPGWENELTGRDSVYSPSPGSNRSSGSRSNVLADQDAHSEPYRGPNG